MPRGWLLVGLALLVGVASGIGVADVALAHDCSSGADCLQTAGYITVISVAGGIIAIIMVLAGRFFGFVLPSPEAEPSEHRKPPPPDLPLDAIFELEPRGELKWDLRPPPSAQRPGTPPPIFAPEQDDSAAMACARMVVHRLTGQDVPEQRLRDFSSHMRYGYRRGLAGAGTSSRGLLELLNAVPTIHAEWRPGITLPQMQAEIEDGNQVVIPHQLPDGPHLVVLNRVQFPPAGDAVLTLDDPSLRGPSPELGAQRQQSNTWWEYWGDPDVVIVIRRVEPPVRSNP
ncbi:MAG: hypothetical protein HY320_07180 [Armatimonadetes bacterium]|nr:hypothetical protein [Armatimonadota bacterium]